MSEELKEKTEPKTPQTDEEIQKSKRDFGLGIYGSKKHISLKTLDKLIGLLVVAVIVCVFIFSRSPGFRVSFDTDGGVPAEIEDQLLKYEEKVAEPEEPKKPGYIFKGWYLSNGYAWNFDTDTVGNDMELKAVYEVDEEALRMLEEQAEAAPEQ